MNALVVEDDGQRHYDAEHNEHGIVLPELLLEQIAPAEGPKGSLVHSVPSSPSCAWMYQLSTRLLCCLLRERARAPAAHSLWLTGAGAQWLALVVEADCLCEIRHARGCSQRVWLSMLRFLLLQLLLPLLLVIV